MRLALALLVAVVTTGCSERTPGGQTEQAPVPAAKAQSGAAPQVPAEDPKVKAFKEAVAHYLAEARVGAKLLTIGPSLAQVKEKSAHITDLYTRLPDIPPGLDPTGKVAERLKNINGTLAVAEGFVGLIDSSNAKKIYDEELPRIAREVNEFAVEIERKLGL